MVGTGKTTFKDWLGGIAVAVGSVALIGVASEIRANDKHTQEFQDHLEVFNTQVVQSKELAQKVGGVEKEVGNLKTTVEGLKAKVDGLDKNIDRQGEAISKLSEQQNEDTKSVLRAIGQLEGKTGGSQ